MGVEPHMKMNKIDLALQNKFNPSSFLPFHKLHTVYQNGYKYKVLPKQITIKLQDNPIGKSILKEIFSPPA